MRTRVLRRRMDYTGAELRSHFAFRLLGIEGDSAIAFLGPCDVTPECMVDLADHRSGSTIRGRLMLHFLVEHFGRGLLAAVLSQRLLAALARDLLQEKSRRSIERRGDDLFVGPRKLSISVATLSPVSALVHFALNVDAALAPVAAASLRDLRVEPRSFARELLRRYSAEEASIAAAIVTVRPVP